MSELHEQEALALLERIARALEHGAAELKRLANAAESANNWADNLEKEEEP